MSESIILYSDLNCPFCYALGERLVHLELDNRVEWRGVEHAPILPVPRVEGNLRIQAGLEHEVRTVRQLAPEVPIRSVSGKPNTRSAIRAIAAAKQQDPVRGRRLQHDLYRALWQCDEDISDPVVIASFAQSHGFHDLLTSAGVGVITNEWTRTWEDIGVGSVPYLVRDDGEALVGLVSMERLRSFVEADRVINRAL